MAKVSLADFTPDTASRREKTPAPEAVGSLAIRELPLDQIATNPLNARTEADEDPEELQRLADTITARGVLQPIVVCGVDAFLEQHPDQRDTVVGSSWVALIGNRRVAGSRLAGVTTIRSVVDVDALGSIDEVMLVENGARRDLHPLREADALGRLRDRDGLTLRDIAHRIGRTHPYVQQRLNLLKLIPELRAALEAGTLLLARARELGALDEATQRRIAATGPPWRGGNAVTTRRARTLPVGDPAAAARSIQELYTGDELDELVRLLSIGRTT